MKLLKQSYERDGGGSIVCECEVPDDVWMLYNLVLPGDKVKCSTTRKLQRESSSGTVFTDVKKIVLDILVKKTEYEGERDILRVSGQVAEESPYVKIGAYHTLEISLNTKLTIYKDCWDRVFLDKLKEACDPHRTAEVQVVLIENGLCHIILLSSVLAKPVAKITAAIPRQRGPHSNYEKAKHRFFTEVVSSLLLHTNFDAVKCVLVAGPGFVKNDFLRFLFEEAAKRDLKSVLKHKHIFVTATTSSGHKQALTELLADPSTTILLENTKAARHAQRLQEFYKLLNKALDEPTTGDHRNLTCYGPDAVSKAAEFGAVKTLLVTDRLLRSVETRQRQQYVRLVTDVEKAGGEVLTFSDQHTSGEQLNMLSGVAAILKFPIDDILEQDDRGDENSKREC